MVRRLVAPALVLAFSLVTVTAAASSAATPATGHGRLSERLELPTGFLPEGIATGRGPFAYLGSRADGDIYRANLVTGTGEVIAQGPGTPSVGLKLDRRGRLFVAGGPAGDARVIDVRTGALLASYRLTTGTSFVNDVVLTKDAAWFTDSQQAVLYRLPLGRAGALPAAAETVPLSGAWEQVEGLNANGIATTPDRTALLVVNSTTGLLFRVDPATGTATQVDLGGASLTSGDGLLVNGRTLYAVRNQLNEVAVIHLDRAGTAGTLAGTLTSDGFDVPTTIARFGAWLYLPNARFTSPQEPTTEFWVTRISPRG